jgi:N-acetylglucosaminyl-diphospho-decaprenol L-rhamnosyltransferase
MISLLVVNYRSASLAAEAIRTARAASSSALQVVVVDNSCDPSEADALRGIADELIVSDFNRGYAGGINLGRRACGGETLLISNPDVVFAPAAIDLLHDALKNASVAGPALFWDDAFTWRLPPADRTTAPEKIDEVLASRSHAWREQRDRRRFQKRLRFWSLTETTQVSVLSGAVMAVRAADFDRFGGFDERFPLYFEETDFLRRVSAARCDIVYVPGARCRHLYNQSARQVPGEAAVRYAQSELRYLEKWNGPFLARLLKRLERPVEAPPPRPLPVPLRLERDDVVIEASPLPTFTTAAGYFPQDRELVVAEEILRTFQGDLYVRVLVHTSGEILGTYKITT